MAERRFELLELHRRLGFPPPSSPVMQALLDIVDEGVLGATNHVALALPLVASVAAEPRPTALAEALELSRFISRTRGVAAPIVANALAWQTHQISEVLGAAAHVILAERARDWDARARARRQDLIVRGQAALESCSAPLIFDFSSTVADLVRALVVGRGIHHVVIPESRAIDGGRRYMAVLSDLRVRMLFLPDAALEYAVSQSDAVLLGAESVSLDGGVVNTVGSTAAARAAQAHGVPVYGAADLFKVGRTLAADLADPPLRTYPFLLKDGEEADTRAPELEIVPPQLISAILTDVGPLAPNEVMNALSLRGA